MVAAEAMRHVHFLMRWGLVPYWAKDIKVGFAHINAKAEGIESKPAFRREASQRRRCLVPVDNFYEGQKRPAANSPTRSASREAGSWRLAQVEIGYPPDTRSCPAFCLH
jgi:putative SOS response-associated peptidase YedK